MPRKVVINVVPHHLHRQIQRGHSRNGHQFGRPEIEKKGGRRRAGRQRVVQKGRLKQPDDAHKKLKDVRAETEHVEHHELPPNAVAKHKTRRRQREQRQQQRDVVCHREGGLGVIVVGVLPIEIQQQHKELQQEFEKRLDERLGYEPNVLSVW